jgi:selenide,water dikinase
LIDPRRIVTNAGAKPGDVLLFSKRIGTGVISTALKQGIAAPGHLDSSIQQMLTLNRVACEAMLARHVHACTDVTGFGLLGHSREMALASNVTLEIRAGAIRLLPGALEYSIAGAYSGGLHNNREFVESCVAIDPTIPKEVEALLYDPQTSGGLLLSLEEHEARKLMAQRHEMYVIGRVKKREAKPIEVIV